MIWMFNHDLILTRQRNAVRVMSFLKYRLSYSATVLKHKKTENHKTATAAKTGIENMLNATGIIARVNDNPRGIGSTPSGIGGSVSARITCINLPFITQRQGKNTASLSRGPVRKEAAHV